MTRQSSSGSPSSLSGEPLSASKQLDELRAALAKAETDAADLASEAKRVEGEVRADLDAVLAEVDLDPDRWRDAQAAALARREGAEAARDYAGARVVALRERATELAEQIGAEKIATAEAKFRAAEVAVVEAEEQLAATQVAKLRAEERLEHVRHEADGLLAEFDPSAAQARADRARQERQVVVWHARNAHADERIPRRLRAAVEAERAKLTAQAAEDRQRMERDARESRLRPLAAGRRPCPCRSCLLRLRRRDLILPARGGASRNCPLGRVWRLVRLQRASQGFESSRPFAFRQQHRSRLHQPHPAEELTLRDVMNNRRLRSASRKYSGRASITGEPNHRSVSRNPIRDGGSKQVTSPRKVPILVASKYAVPLPMGTSEVWPHLRNKPVRCIQVV